jgi:2-polyprenyl-6-methoxyphenol hydroxylase-like FAD-dependent oxidoreductase
MLGIVLDVSQLWRAKIVLVKNGQSFKTTRLPCTTCCRSCTRQNHGPKLSMQSRRMLSAKLFRSGREYWGGAFHTCPRLTLAFRFFKVPELSSWSSDSGRIIVMGDAAHAMPPTGGQGAAMAFEDALTLADALSVIQTQEMAPEGTIKNWQSTRQARVKKILAFTSKGGDMRKHSPSTAQQIVKEWLMRGYFFWVGEDAGLSWIYDFDTRKQGGD